MQPNIKKLVYAIHQGSVVSIVFFLFFFLSPTGPKKSNDTADHTDRGFLCLNEVKHVKGKPSITVYIRRVKKKRGLKIKIQTKKYNQCHVSVNLTRGSNCT